MPGRRGSRDLVLASAAALLSLALVATSFTGLPAGLALVPLVLLLPGFALTAAFFPGRSLAPTERLLYSVALSVGAASLVGLLWQLAFGLDRVAWAALLTATVLIACGVAHRRRSTWREPVARPAGPRPRLGLPTALAGLAGVAIAVVAVILATEGVREQRAESHFSALWAVPAKQRPRGVEVGVWNHQHAAHSYRLEVRGNGAPIWTWKGRLGPSKRLEVVLGPARIPAASRLVVSLYRDGSVYRRTELQTGAET